MKFKLYERIKMRKDQIYYLSLENILDKELLKKYIYPSVSNNYYWSDDFSVEFYTHLALAGFITVTYNADGKIILLPEIQKEYALLDFKDLKIPSKVKKLINKKEYIFSINEKYDEVIQNLKTYHKDSWIVDEYIEILNQMIGKTINDVELKSIELSDKDGNLVAGEIGYKIGSTFTSLSGFFKREKKYNNWGKLQLVLLAKHLEENGYKLWNLGHPYMDYKYDLGAKIYSRLEFLVRWKRAIINKE